jgi:uncharacterized protein (DUF2147 family)
MKKITAAVVVILLYAVSVYADDPAEGFWFSMDSRTGEIMSGWEIYISNGYLYGKMISAVNRSPDDKAVKCRDSYANFPIQGKVNQLTILNTPWIFGLSMESTGVWTNGSVISFDDGNLFKCSVIYHPADGKKFKQEALEIRGQILLLSGSQYWRRATREEASGLRKKN